MKLRTMPGDIAERNELPRGQIKKNSNKYKNNKIKLKDEVGMTVPKLHKQIFCSDDYTHYTFLRLLFDHE